MPPSGATARERAASGPRRAGIVFAILLVILFAAAVNALVVWSETRPPAITGGEDEGAGGTVVLPIGVVLPQSGLLGSEGVKMVDGAKLAEADINAAGGIKLAGNVTAKVELHIEDDKTDVGFGKQAAQYLVSVKHVEAIVGSAGSSVTLSVGEVTAPEKVFLISPASTSPLLSGKPWIFRTVGSDLLQGQAMLDLVVALANAGKVSKKAYIFSILNAYGAGLTQVMKEYAASRGIEIIGDQLYEEQKENFDAEMEAIRKAREQKAPGETVAVMFTSYPEAAVRVLTTAQKLGVTQAKGFQWVSNDGIAHSELITQDATAREAAQGLYGTNPATPPEDPTYRDFYQHYNEVYKETPASYAATAYDGVMVIAEAVRRAGAYDGERMREEAVKMTGNASYKGVSGAKEFDQNGDLTYQWYEIYKVTGDKFLPTGAWWDDPKEGVKNFTGGALRSMPPEGPRAKAGGVPPPDPKEASRFGASCSPAPCLRVVEPRTGDALRGGSAHNITWVSNGTQGSAAASISLDGGMSWALLKDNLSLNGTIRWDVPKADTSKAQVRLAAGTANATMINDTGDFFIDSTAPKSSVRPLPAVLNISYTDQYPVRFDFDDGPQGSGLAKATLWVKVERRGDNFSSDAISNRSPLMFTPGKEGRHFFFTITEDRAGNVEAEKWQDLDGEAQAWIDVAPPSVSGTIPNNGEQGVDFAPTFEVVFSEFMKTETVKIESTRGSPPIPGPGAKGVSWSYFKDRLYFVLAEPLHLNESYEVAITGGRDTIDKQMDPFYLRFRTRSVPENASAVSGLVYDAVSRAPIAEAEIRALYNGTTIEVGRATSDSTGEFSFSGLAPTEIEFRASAPGYSERVVRTLLGARESRTLNISLAQQGLAVGVIRGKVIDEAGKPVEGALVATGLAAATTGADGRFEVAVRAGAAEVEVSKDGFTSAKRSVSLAADEDRTENFRLLRIKGLTFGGIGVIVGVDAVAALLVIALLRKLRASKKEEKEEAPSPPQPPKEEAAPPPAPP
jgi:branched-chain amino acid transport system substrate-binding protein